GAGRGRQIHDRNRRAPLRHHLGGCSRHAGRAADEHCLLPFELHGARSYFACMAIAITEDHNALGETVVVFLAKRDARGAARKLLTASEESLPDFWDDIAALGWLGLHVPEEFGGSGYGLAELVVVVEELGRALTPGPFVPTVIASATLVAAGAG